MKKLKEIIQSFLGLRAVRVIVARLSSAVAVLFSWSYLFSVPYHWFAFLNFMREQRAVLYGKKKYYQNLARHTSSRVELRRNIHRLEKGLIMRPRRDVFAGSYILETVESYKKAVDALDNGNCNPDMDELTWANNVLTEYFQASKAAGSIARARELFESIEFSPEERGKIPFVREKKNLPSYEQMLNLSEYRRSVRWFLDREVEESLIDQALLVARQAPSACNRLPYEFRIFTRKDLVEKVVSIPFGTVGYAENVPAVAVVVGKLESYFSARDRHAIYVDSSLAAMSFAFALETLGLSTCMINWPDFEPLEQKMQRTLNLDYSDRVIMLMAIGYADPEATVPYSQKKSLEVIRSYNRLR